MLKSEQNVKNIIESGKFNLYNYQEISKLRDLLYASNYSKAISISLIATLQSLQDFLTITATHIFFTKLHLAQNKEQDFDIVLDNIFIAITNLHALNEVIEDIYDQKEQALISNTVDYCIRTVALRIKKLLNIDNEFYTSYYRESRLRKFLELNGYCIQS